MDAACPRYLSLGLSPDVGIGHRLSEVLFGWHAATELGATYVSEEVSAWTTPREDQSYWWIHGLLGIAAGEVVSENVLAARPWPFSPAPESPAASATRPERVVVCPYTDARTRYGDRCNVQFVMASYMCCPGGDCFRSPALHGLYDRMKGCLRWKRAHGAILPRNSVNVVWHLRVGDIELHNDDPHFFSAVWAQLETALAGAPVVNAIVVSGPEYRPTLPRPFAFLSGILPNITVLPSLSAFLGHAIFEAADVLVSTGSSFPEVAALVVDGPLFLHHVPKHIAPGFDGGFNGLMEYMSDAVPLYPTGRLGVPVPEIRARLQARLCAQSAGRFGQESGFCA